MIRWNKWTRDYTYTYLWDKGIWKLIHKKSNKPYFYKLSNYIGRAIRVLEID